MRNFLVSTVTWVLFPTLIAHGAVSYSVVGSTYAQNFNGLPTDAPNNANLESLYSDGWQDDVDPAATPQNDISIPGWYLHHPQSNPAFTDGEGGFNGHQRVRMGDGSSATGAFWLYGAGGAADPEKALGFLNSDLLANPASLPTPAQGMSIGLRMTNNTSRTLERLLLKFNGEQWRDGVPDPNAAEQVTVRLIHSTTSNPVGADNWYSTTHGGTLVSATFVAPVVGTANAAVDGNGAGRRAFSLNVSISWEPGADLWLRWDDLNGPGPDDGLAIDDIEIRAVPEPSTLVLAGMLTLCLGRGRRQLERRFTKSGAVFQSRALPGG